MADKICIVVQRYGLEVNGGAELEARLLAEHLVPLYPEVHVLTTKAIDYMSWKDEYEADVEDINGVTVHRFSVARERNIDEFSEINGRFVSGRLKASEEEEWLESQGPLVPDLLRYIEQNKDEYDAFIFFTYLYYPTANGVKLVSDKAITVPTAHDEPYLRMSIFDDVFLSPKAILFNTDEERKLVTEKYHNEGTPYEIGATGVDIPDHVDAQRFKIKYGLDDFIVYVGRIDDGKNCGQLFAYFDRYKDTHDGNLKLVLMGKAVMPVPEREDVVSLGFVHEQDKFDGIKAAKALILPSKYESLSYSVIEAMRVGTPVIVNGECEVLRQHCIKSNGALYYMNYLEFEAELDFILDNPEIVEVMLDNAKDYADENYRWDSVVKRVCSLLEFVKGPSQE